MSNIMICPYGHWFSKTRHESICPMCGFDLDTPEKVYVRLRKECELSIKEVRPVCAWFICIEGARKGKSYKISYGNNFVGKDRECEIQVLQDEKIKDKHTLIFFDKATNEAALLPPRADGIVYKDNTPVYDRYIIKNKDILELGNSKFMYVEFIGRYKDTWEEGEIKLNKEEKDKEELQERKYRFLKGKMPTEEEKYIKKRLDKKLSVEEEFPICAWIVCIEGARKGQSYNIIEEKNYIGKDDTMSIQVLGDEEIRDIRDTVIAFDMRNLTGTLHGGQCKGFIRLNDNAVYESAKLESGDIIDIGKSRFMYVCFAGDYHKW